MMTLPPEWVLVAAPISNDIFFNLATILNLNNWTKYYFKISSIANPQLKFKKQIKIVDILTYCYFVFSICLYGFYIFTELNEVEEDSENEDIVNITIGIYTIILGIIFALASIMINRNLKLNFKQFYSQYRKILIFTTFGLSLPMIIEGAIELIILNKEAEKKLKNNLAAYNAFEFIFCYLMPTIF